MPVAHRHTPRRWHAPLTALAMLLALLPVAVAAAPSANDALSGPQITAPAAAVIDLASGEVLWSRDLHGLRAPASVTKMLTALTAVDLAPLDTKITVQQSDLVGEASMGAPAGETLTLETLLYGMLLPSGNDAATAIARSLGKQPGDTTPEQSIQRFVERMNAKAKVLGAKETRFTNPHGLDDPNHRTSAYDLGVIGAAFAANATLLRIAGTVTYDGGNLTLHTTNKLLYDGRYPAIVGGKTGQTDEAGYTLVEIATKNGRALLSVELGTTAEAFWTDAMALLDYGFATPASSRPKASGNLAPAPSSGSAPRAPEMLPPANAAAASFIPIPPGAAETVNRAARGPQTIAANASDTPAAAPAVLPPAPAVQTLSVVASPDRARLRLTLFALLATIVGGVFIARRAALRQALAEARHEWQAALADPPHLVGTTVLPVIAAGGAAASVSARWEQIGVRIPKEEVEVARAFALRAVRQAATGDRDAARQAFRRTVALDPKLPWGTLHGFWDLPPASYLDLAHAMIETGHPAEARAMLTVAALVHPRDPEIRALEARLTGRPIPPPFRLVASAHR